VRLPIADTSRIELVARTVVNLRLRPCHASLIGGDRRNSPGSLAKFAAMRPRLVARQPIWSPNGATQQYVRNRGRSGSARPALETTLMTRPPASNSAAGLKLVQLVREERALTSLPARVADTAAVSA
jgi:hypothetical protein